MMKESAEPKISRPHIVIKQPSVAESSSDEDEEEDEEEDIEFKQKREARM